MSKKPILDGHKKVGKKFIPPMKQIGNIVEVSYVNHTLPELIWMGLLHDYYGFKKGIALVELITRRAFEKRQTEDHTNFAICSNFNILSESSRSELLNDPDIIEVQPLISAALQPLHSLYNEFPMSFLCLPSDVSRRTEFLETLSNCLLKHFDKFDVPACMMQANVTHVRGINGGIHYAEGLQPNLNEIMGDPDSPKTQRAMAQARIGAMMEFKQSHLDDQQSWSRTFWNQGLKVDQCTFEERIANDTQGN